MTPRVKPLVWLHSCVVIPGCECGERIWEVQTPDGFMWSRHEGPGNFDTLEAAMNYAASLHASHPDVVLIETSVLSDCKAEVKRLGIFIEKQTLEIKRLRLTSRIFRC